MIMGLNFLSYILLLTGFISSVLSGLNSPVFWSFTFFTGVVPGILVMIVGWFAGKAAKNLGEKYLYSVKILKDLIDESEAGENDGQ